MFPIIRIFDLYRLHVDCMVLFCDCRPTGSETFMTANNIETGSGYPIEIGNEPHIRTLLVIIYQKNNELCQAAASATGNGKRRKKRQVTFDSSQLAITQDLLQEILNYQR